MKPEKFFLIRDASELSQEVENFLSERHFDYNVFYAERNNKLPIIYTSEGYAPYQGATGFIIFKMSHNVDQSNSIQAKFLNE